MVLSCLVLATLHVSAATNTDKDAAWYVQFINGIARPMYFFAWPTATYERVSLGSITNVSNGANVTIILHGISAFSDGPLWTELNIKFRNGEITDMGWGDHNALLFPPGASMVGFGEILSELNKELSAPSRGTPPQTLGAKFKVGNKCGRTLKLAIHYLDSSDQWQSDGWWKFVANEFSYLKLPNGNFATSKNRVFYFYAETEDKQIEWSGGDYSSVYSGRSLNMRKMEDNEGDLDLVLTCN